MIMLAKGNRSQQVLTLLLYPFVWIVKYFPAAAKCVLHNCRIGLIGSENRTSHNAIVAPARLFPALHDSRLELTLLVKRRKLMSSLQKSTNFQNRHCQI